jgi:hypothetical protein
MHTIYIFSWKGDTATLFGLLDEEGMSAGTLADVPIRNLIIEDIVERSGIDEVMIEQLVRTFYSRARFDPLVGPVFESRVHDLEGHIAGCALAGRPSR